MKVCMFVYNNCLRDARVLKEADTLSEAGYDVRIIAVLDKLTQPYEERNGIKIIRMIKDPIHYKLIRLTNRSVKIIRYLLYPLKDIFKGLLLILNGLFNFIFCFFPFIKGRLTKSKVTLSVKRFLKKDLKIEGRIRKLFLRFHRPLSFLDYYYRCFRLLKKEPADIYHANDLNTLPIACLAKFFLGGRIVYDSHELYTELSAFSHSIKVFLKNLENFLIRRVDNVITVNYSIAEELSRRYKISLPTVIMNCPPKAKIKDVVENNTLRSKLGLEQGVPIVLYHGGFLPNRGLKNLIQSTRYFDKEILVLMGWGKIEKELRDLVADECLGDKIRFTEPVSQEELLEYAASADLGVIPYQFVGLNNYYTTPNKLFEYIASGLPVVGSDFPELKKVIEGYKLGRTFNPEDPKDIAESIEYVFSDGPRYRAMKDNVLKAAKIFNWENESKKLLLIYDSFKGK